MTTNGGAGGLEKLLRHVTKDIADRASVAWDVHEHDGVSSMRATPYQSESCPFSIAWSSHEIVVDFGRGSRIELSPGNEDLDLLIQVVLSIIKGRVKEFEWKSRTAYEISLEAGRVLSNWGITDSLLRKLSKLKEIQWGPY